MRPCVICAKSPCDFAGKQGPEMNKHLKMEHRTEFKCNECDFKTKYKVLRRSHMMKNHYKKCETCDFTATQAGRAWNLVKFHGIHDDQ